MVSGILLAALAAQSTPDTMPANSWLAAPNTKMRAIAPANGQFAGTWGTGGPANVIGAWCGGTLDTLRNRLVLWGGGHGDYYGNELYAFDVDTMTWSRLTDPTINPTLDQDINWDGKPASRHTYNGLAYIAHADRFFGLGGSVQGNGFGSCQNTWIFDFNAGTWRNATPGGTKPTTAFGNNCSYDPETKKVWWCENNAAGLYSYDYDTNTWAKRNSDSFYYYTSTVDTKRGVMVIVGNGNVYAYDLRGGNYARQTWATSGDTGLVGNTNPGLDYDPAADRIVGWNGGSVYVLDPATKVWTANNPPGAPARSQWGTYGRWRYVPSVNAFVVVNHIDQDVSFYKLTAGGGGGGSSDTTAPTVSITTPTTAPTAMAASSPVALGGSAADNVGVAQVTWSNALTGGAGTAGGTASWTASVPLAGGSNAITLTALDAAGNRSSDTITVAYTPPPSGDTDGDGLPDAWEMQYFQNLNETGSGDPDGDGASNAQEYAAGTDPTDPLSLPGGGGAVASSGGDGQEGFCGALGAEALAVLAAAAVAARARRRRHRKTIIQSTGQ